MYCWPDYRLEAAEEDEEAVLLALITNFPELHNPYVEDLDQGLYNTVRVMYCIVPTQYG